MKLALIILLFFPFYFLSAGEAKAIVVVPALILIPVIKIVAAIVGSIALPVLGVGAFWGKLKKNSLFKGIAIGSIVLICIALVAGFIIWFQNPERPLF